MLWIRLLDSLQAQELAGTQDASYPFWSPDSRWIAFFSGGKLKKIEASGGPPLTLCDAPNPRGGTWNQEGVILFDPTLNEPLYRVSASGGTVTPATSLNFSKGEISHRWPYFLPDGRHFLYLTFGPSLNEVMLGSLDSKESKSLVRSEGSAAYAAGNLLFLRQNTLMAQPFDVKQLELTGDAVPIVDPVQREEVTRRSIFSVSQNGLLAYLEGAGNANRQLIWVDRSGKKVGEVPGADAYRNPRLSPDGKKILYTIETAEFDLWSYDTLRGVKTRLTFGSNSGSPSFDGVWAPDGQRIAYTSVRGAKFGFYEKAANGSGNEQLLMDSPDIVQRVNDWSPDGKFLVFQHNVPGALAISLLPLDGTREPRTFLKSQYAMVRAAFSPDGKWVAYCSNESGDLKVYVVPFPGPGGKWQVSPGSGDFPRWRRDGKELFYLSLDNKMMAAEVKTSETSFTSGAVSELFETRAYWSMVGSYDVTADGQRFLIAYEPERPDAMITVVENWDAELRKR
jgi:Tol biopolymer transport system component